MNITINLTDEQIKALLTYYETIESYVQSVVENRANRIINELVKDYANKKFEVEGLTSAEEKTIAKQDRIITNVDKIPEEIKKIIIKRGVLKTAIEKAEEEKV